MSHLFLYFYRLNTVNPVPKPDLPTEAVMWQLVRLFANPHESGLRQRCSKLSQAIARYEPSLKSSLRDRRKSLDNTVQGLGKHGLTTDQNGQLICLHIALKSELQRHIDVYKQAIHKLEELSALTINQNPALSSHQRLLGISYADIQQRLIDNKTILTILDKPALKQLPLLIENLTQRVQNDKEVLCAVGQIKRTDPQANFEKRPAAGLLMNFSRGCDVILNLMGPDDIIPPRGAVGSKDSVGKTVTDGSSNSSFSDGYHSDDSTTNSADER